MLRDRLFVASESGERPRPGGLGVRHRLQRGEGFRRDDEECFRWIEAVNGLREVGAIDIRHKTKCHASIRVVLQRLVSHYRAEIRATDTDIDYLTNALAGVPFPFTVSQTVCEGRHPVEYGMDLGDH